MITTNVMYRTYCLKYQGRLGTSFSIDLNGNQYLVTAHHVIKGIKNDDSIEIYHDNSWKQLPPTTLVGFKVEQDIAVLSPRNFCLAPSDLPLTVQIGEYYISQSVFFLGFPDGILTSGTSLNKFHIPFIRQAIISQVDINDETNKIYLDGHNNKGFSGGPVVLKTPKSKDWKVAGVISAYRSESIPVVDKRRTPTDYQVFENSGITIAYGSRHIVEIIENK